MKSKEKKMLWIVGFIAVASAAGYASSFFMGDDNEVEEALEEVTERMTERQMDLPVGSIDVDLTPSSPEHK